MRTVKLSVVVVLAGLVGCGPKVATIEIAPKEVVLAKKGDAASLVGTAKDAEGKKVENPVLVWASSDPTVAAVDGATGKVTGLKTGDAKVTATYQTIVGEAKVRVSIPASISFAPAVLTLTGPGGKGRVVAKVLDEKGREASAKLSWESADAKVATVSPAGEITGVAPGETQVFAVVGELRAPVKVVVPAPTAAALEVGKAVTMKLGGKPIALEVVAKDAAGKDMAGAQLSFSIADAKVATVDTAGAVTPVGKGKTKVTVTSGDKSAEIDITVK